MKSMTLYEISDQYRVASDALADMDLPPEAVQDTLEGIAGDFKDKALAVGYVSGNLSAASAQIREAIKRMQARADAIDRREEAINEYLKTQMEKTGITEISGPHFALKIKKNPPKVEVFSEELVPAEYDTPPKPQPRIIDKRKLMDDMKEGKEIPGARKVQTTRLEIK